MRGSQLTDWRKKNDLSQAELAHTLRVNRQTVIAWEKSERVPPLVEIALTAIDHRLVDLEPHRQPARLQRPKRVALDDAISEAGSGRVFSQVSAGNSAIEPFDGGLEGATAESISGNVRGEPDAVVAEDRTKSQFLANMSHELRTPLNAIIGFSEVIADEMFGPVGTAKYREYAREIHRSGQHLLDIVNDILDLSKLQAGKLELLEEVFDVTDVVETVIRSARRMLDAKNMKLTVAVAQDAQKMFADKRAVTQILLNLISNGAKFSSDCGEIRISVDRDASGVGIAVSDSGVGIAANDLSALNEALARVNGEDQHWGRGISLGLMLVKGLTALHEGDVVIESSAGEGTTVRLRLPRAATEKYGYPAIDLTKSALRGAA